MSMRFQNRWNSTTPNALLYTVPFPPKFQGQIYGYWITVVADIPWVSVSVQLVELAQPLIVEFVKNTEGQMEKRWKVLSWSTTATNSSIVY